MTLCSTCKIQKTPVEFYRDRATKSGLRPNCKACVSNQQQKYYIENKEEHSLKCQEYYNKNSESIIKRTKEYNLSNPEINKQATLKYRKNNAEAINFKSRIRYWDNLEQEKLRNKAYRENNPHRSVARCAKYRAVKLKATPVWLTENQHEEILAFYERANYLTSMTGITHEVDHIIPLQGKNVRGLHVPWNLQVLTQKENRKKGNKII